MTDKMETALMWCDVETTGLDPARDAILEVACLFTDLRLAEKPAPGGVHSFGCARRLDAAGVDAFRRWAAPHVVAMHEQNNLLRDCEGYNARTLSVMEELLLAELDKLQGRCTVHLAGSSPRLDYEFLRHQMPRVHERLHHRCFDVRTLVMAHDAWMAPLFGWTDPLPPKGDGSSAHRAWPDALWALEVARRFKGRLELLASHE